MRILIEDGDRLRRANNLLSGSVPSYIFRAAKAALKRAGDTAKSKAGSFAAMEYTISNGTFLRNVTVRSRIDSGNSAGGAVSMRISFAGRVLPLLQFNTRFSRNGRVTTSVKKNGGATTLQHAFVEAVYGQTAVFERDGSSRFPVHQLYGPSTAQMMANQQVRKNMEDTIRDTFEKRFDHEVSRILNGWGRNA